MLKIQQEVTEWKDTAFRQPNHVYLVCGDRAYAYSRWGESPPEYFHMPTRMNQRGRRFIEVKKNSWGFNLQLKIAEFEKSQERIWKIQGSRGDIYTVRLLDGRWSCTCPGATFRSTCRHITQFLGSKISK